MTTYSMYQHYKPLRNHLAKYSVLSGLRVVWLHTRQHSWAGLQQKLQDASCSMLPWELEQVVRELVLNGILAAGCKMPSHADRGHFKGPCALFEGCHGSFSALDPSAERLVG